jgi:hypothetical protein
VGALESRNVDNVLDPIDDRELVLVELGVR